VSAFCPGPVLAGQFDTGFSSTLSTSDLHLRHVRADCRVEVREPLGRTQLSSCAGKGRSLAITSAKRPTAARIGGILRKNAVLSDNSRKTGFQETTPRRSGLTGYFSGKPTSWELIRNCAADDCILALGVGSVFNEYQMVRLKHPAGGLAAGTLGTVLMAYTHPKPGYEVEFAMWTDSSARYLLCTMTI
jgi:hypothetical protein